MMHCCLDYDTCRRATIAEVGEGGRRREEGRKVGGEKREEGDRERREKEREGVTPGLFFHS
jgi:hypothetical protein